MIRVFHDDIRDPPGDGWTVARTNKEVIDLFREHGNNIVEISLDHDLGLDYLVGTNLPPGQRVNLRGSSPDGTGYDLVKWMIENECVPVRVVIHSWSAPGAKRMAHALRYAGYDCIVQPY